MTGKPTSTGGCQQLVPCGQPHPVRVWGSELQAVRKVLDISCSSRIYFGGVIQDLGGEKLVDHVLPGFSCYPMSTANSVKNEWLGYSERGFVGAWFADLIAAGL